MNHPLRANIEIVILEGTEWVRCSKCQRKHCRAGEDWRRFCKVRFLPPTKAGGLMSDLNGQYLLRQYYCPSCAVLLETDFIEDKVNDAGRA